MAQEDTLRLAAEIVDKFSGPLREMQKSLRQFRDNLKGSHVDSAKAAKEAAERQAKLNERVIETGRALTGTLTPALAAMGIEFGGAGVVLAGFIGKLKEAGDNFYRIQGAMQATGMSSGGLQTFTRWMGEFGISADRAQASAQAMGDVLARLGRENSAEVQRLEGTFNNLHGLISSMEAAQSQAERMKQFMDYYLSHPAPPDQRRRLLEAFNLPVEIASASYEQLREEILRAEQFTKDHPPLDPDVAWKLHTAFAKIKEELDGFNNDLLNAYGGSGVTAVEKFSGMLHQELEDIKWLIEKFAELNSWLDKIGGHGDPLADLSNRLLHPGQKMSPTELEKRFLDKLNEPKTPPVPGTMPFPGQKFQTFPNKLYQPSSFGESGGGRDAEDALATGVKRGMLDAFREWFASVSAGAGAGGGGGFQNASYSPGGGGGGRGFGSDTYPNLGGGRVSGGGGPTGVSPESSDYSMTQGGGPLGPFERSRFNTELANNQALRNKIMRIAANEQGKHAEGTQAVIESMMNRAAMRRTSLEKEARWTGEGGYYAQGNMGRGALENPQHRAILEQGLKNALAGADTIGLATDNSSQGLAEREAASGKFIRHRKIHGESFFHPGWAEPKFRDRWLAMKDDHDRQIASRDRDLLTNSAAAGVTGSPQKFEGNADVNVRFENAPAGAKAYMKYGGLFKSGTVDWGHPMAASNPSGVD